MEKYKEFHDRYFAVEYALSNKSTCVFCNEKIELGKLRIIMHIRVSFKDVK